MVDFLKVTFEKDTSKEYHFIDDQMNALIRQQEEREAFLLRDCKNSHLISFHADGSVQQKLPIRYLDVTFEVEDVALDSIDNNENYEVLENEYVCEAVMSDDGKLDLVEVGSFVAIKAPSSEP